MIASQNLLKWIGAFFLACILIPLESKAEIVKCLTLVANDETEIYFPLIDEPIVIFSKVPDGELPYIMEVSTETNTISVSTLNQDMFKITDVDFTSVSVESISNEPDIEITGDCIVIDSKHNATEYSVVSVNGMVFKHGFLCQGRNILNLSEFESGYYILRVKKETVKIKIK